ncbi:OmpA family protein [Nitratireductor luteus]|uniref:OmpA family protein n=1 Tax=Nitratireductor luteus TaxID=2976980 RepID=UPI00223F86A1|nr:OmpA family protein [Nitratireductor luteus]
MAGTALSLLMAGSATAEERAVGGPVTPDGVIILAQAEEPAGEGGECPPGTAPTGPDGACVPAVEKEGEEPAAEPAPTEEPPSAEEKPPAETQEAPAAEGEEAPADAPVESEPAPVEEQVTPPVDAEAEQPAETEEAPAAEGEEAPADAPVESEPAPVEEQVTPPADAEAEQPAETMEAPAETTEEPTVEGSEELPADEPVETPATQEPAPTDETVVEPTGEAEQTVPDEGEAVEDCPPGTVRAADGGECVAAEPPAEEETDADAPTDGAVEEEEPIDGGTAAEPGAEDDTAVEGEATPSEDAAPVLDSQKNGEAEPEATVEGEEQPVEDGQEEQATEEAPSPESDAEAQVDLVDPETLRTEIRQMVEQEGERIELGQTPEDTRMRRQELLGQVPEGAQVIEEYNDNRKIIQYNNNIYIESPDYDRLVRRDDLVYYDDLRGDRVREVIERPDGTRIITIRNRYGDVLRRVRVMPDGREYVLVYVPEDRFDRVARYEDPVVELGPLRLTIPISEYVLEARRVESAERYYEFLDQPPVEQVQRLYSLEEVKRSPRVRDMVRRIDLDTIEFEFGSARIEEREIRDIESLATAMERLLEENPAETFLIEGHTDAVGSENANLALSDRRAEAVARALTDVFGLPPENLVTQGYGEQYLKINTPEPERENRRVAVRRITPLVSPVAERQ